MAIIIVKLGECRNVSSVNWCSCVNVYVRLSVWEWDCVCERPHCHVLWPSIRCPFSARATIHHHDDPLWNPIIPLKLERNRESTNLGCIPRIKRAWWENHVRYSNQCCCIPFELQGSERTKSACQLDTSLLIFEKPRPNLCDKPLLTSFPNGGHQSVWSLEAERTFCPQVSLSSLCPSMQQKVSCHSA